MKSSGTTASERNPPDDMPLICRFYGIRIYMYYDEHNPPHFHAVYNKFQAQIEISSGRVMRGKLPGRALKFIREWKSLHQKELLENWNRAQQAEKPQRIQPLD